VQEVDFLVLISSEKRPERTETPVTVNEIFIGKVVALL
jgi:hypothetical protein